MVKEQVMTATPFADGVSLRRERLTALLARNWWAIGLRGALAIVFGLIALFRPGATMLSLVIVFAVYAFADGVFGVVSAVRAGQSGHRWGLLAFEGVVNVGVGVIAVLWPGITLVAFVLLMAVWAMMTGALELATAFRLGTQDGRGWLVVGGLVSLLFGALLLVAPMLGAVVLTWWLGVYALIFGVALVVLAFKLKAKLDEHRRA
jgi:uncharacterized membrane protein HdeD (DUF308 family)